MNDAAALDWSLIRSVLAVAEAGSLSAAARTLGLSQPTLGRQVQAAEAQLGVTLFRRHARGFELTEEGAALMEPARAMAEGAARIALLAAGQETRLTGTVRISASVVIAHYTLPPILARLRAAEPEIEVELNATDATDNLLYREADIALRMFRPTQGEIVTRHIRDLPLGTYAARSYLDRRGRPQTMAEALRHDWVGLDRSELLREGFAALGHPVPRSFFGTRCDDHAVVLQLIVAGCGIGIVQKAVARRLPGLEPLLPDLVLPPLPLWLAAPEALRHTPRLRRVWDFLATELGRIADA